MSLIKKLFWFGFSLFAFASLEAKQIDLEINSIEQTKRFFLMQDASLRIVVLSSVCIKINRQRLRHEVPQQRIFLEHFVSKIFDSISTSLEMICKLLCQLVNPSICMVVVSINTSLQTFYFVLKRLS